MRKRPSQNSVPRSDSSVHRLSRRAVVTGLPLLMTGCAGGGMFPGGYETTQDGGFIFPPIDVTTIDPSLMRQEIAWHGKEKPGSIVVNVPQRRLYLVQANGRALRYAVGVGRTEGVNFRGSAEIGRKEKCQRLHPPVQPGHHRSLQPRAGRHACNGCAGVRQSWAQAAGRMAVCAGLFAQRAKL